MSSSVRFDPTEFADSAKAQCAAWERRRQLAAAGQPKWWGNVSTMKTTMEGAVLKDKDGNFLRVIGSPVARRVGNDTRNMW